MVQVKQLDGHDFGSLSIVSLDRAEVFAPMAHDEDAPALGGFFGGRTPGHASKIMDQCRKASRPPCYILLPN
jgi:hypothetical protein